MFSAQFFFLRHPFSEWWPILCLSILTSHLDFIPEKSVLEMNDDNLWCTVAITGSTILDQWEIITKYLWNPVPHTYLLFIGNLFLDHWCCFTKACWFCLLLDIFLLLWKNFEDLSCLYGYINKQCQLTFMGNKDTKMCLSSWSGTESHFLYFYEVKIINVK